jgi:hypothetical protein
MVLRNKGIQLQTTHNFRLEISHMISYDFHFVEMSAASQVVSKRTAERLSHTNIQLGVDLHPCSIPKDLMYQIMGHQPLKAKAPGYEKGIPLEVC